MTFPLKEMQGFITPWLERVKAQGEQKAKVAESNYDYDTAQTHLETSKILGWIISANQRPTNQQTGLVNNYSETHYHTHVASTSSSHSKDSLDPESAKKKKEEVNWKNIAVITFTCTVITSISVFVYTRLAKTEQRAQNYLEKTKMIKAFAETSIFKNNEYIVALKTVADSQQKIDQNAVDKIVGYKHATLAALVGTIAAGAGAIAMPWFAAASTVAVIAGMTIGAGSVVYATYNLAAHWDDNEDVKRELEELKSPLAKLSNPIQESFSGMPSAPPLEGFDYPPSYQESQNNYGYGYVATEAQRPQQFLYPTLPTKHWA